MTIYHLGLIGYPLSYSLSPKIHTAALNACGLRGDYSLFPIHPGDTQALKEILACLRKGGIQGLNVTIPHKQSIIPLIDELTPAALSIGAINTIYLRDNKMIGDNTDMQGFLADLRRFLEECSSPGLREALRAREKSALVLGAGGAARAVVYALLLEGWHVNLAARRREQARTIATFFTHYTVHIEDFVDFQSPDFDLIVNATPLGMTPDIDQSPVPENAILSPRTTIYDLVYSPCETKLVKDARVRGIHATTGLGMLIEQAALAFELWTGHTPPREVMLDAVNETAR